MVTIEDPIEFLFTDDKATISQREVGTDTPTFREALRNSVRQDPDVVMVGEMRDLETMSTVMTAAETGHLVFSTLHTNSPAQTVDRIIDSFPPDQQDQVRGQLALVLRAIVSMQLVERADGSERLSGVRNHDQLAEDPEAHRARRDQGNHRGNGKLGELLPHADHEPESDRPARPRRDHLRAGVGASSEPDDLSLKLRKMFPKIEDRFREGDMSPSPADFSQITELLETKKLYEDAEERHRLKLAEKDTQVRDLENEISELRGLMMDNSETTEEWQRKVENAEAEAARIREESQQKINLLNERIRELNQKIQDGGKAGAGFFKR